MKESVAEYLVRDARETRIFNAPVNHDADPVAQVISDINHEEMLTTLSECD